MKNALVIDKSFLDSFGIKGTDLFILEDKSKSFYEQNFRLVDRAICETDDSTLQIIPYVVLSKPSPLTGEKEVYMYRRGKAGDENRLHAKFSIGLGGHIETMPAEGESIIEFMIDDAFRELEEEIGLTFTSEIKAQTKTNYGAYLNSYGLTLIYNNSDDVGKVHLGVIFDFAVDSSFDLASLKKEENVIELGEFITLSDLKAQYETGEIDLEEWSKGVVSYLDNSSNLIKSMQASLNKLLTAFNDPSTDLNKKLFLSGNFSSFVNAVTGVEQQETLPVAGDEVMAGDEIMPEDTY
jgi:predicted NUDIX family phosphoesterase